MFILGMCLSISFLLSSALPSYGNHKRLTSPPQRLRSRYTPLPTTKAVILGQDPYHNVNQAHGLCFSVLPPTRAPPSLQNMYKCLQRDYPTFRPPPQNSGLLTPWAEQGVLLLNTCLTVRAHEANSHAGRGWERFTGRVIEIVEKERRGGVVFLAWGAPAQKRVARVDKKRHCVLASAHPSPLSAARGFVSSFFSFLPLAVQKGEGGNGGLMSLVRAVRLRTFPQDE